MILEIASTTSFYLLKAVEGKLKGTATLATLGIRESGRTGKSRRSKAMATEVMSYSHLIGQRTAAPATFLTEEGIYGPENSCRGTAPVRRNETFIEVKMYAKGFRVAAILFFFAEVELIPPTRKVEVPSKSIASLSR